MKIKILTKIKTKTKAKTKSQNNEQQHVLSGGQRSGKAVDNEE